MKAISLTQPWATLVAIGAKKIETRSWRTDYRGPLAIHAAKGLGKGGMRAHKELCGTEPFCSVLNAALKAWDTPPKSLREMAERPFMPFGAIVAVCRICEVTRMEDLAIPDHGPGRWLYGRSVWVGQQVSHHLSDQEYTFGLYERGRYAWLLADVRALPEPIPCKGALGLWEPDTLTQLAITRQEIAQL